MMQANISQGKNQINDRTRTMVLVILSAAVFFLSFMIQSLNVALPMIGKEFGADAIVLNWLVLVFVLTVAAFSVPFGRIADIIGIKKVILIGLVIYLISTVLAFFANSILMLIISRAIQGFGSGMVMANNPAFISAIFPVHKRGWALGINVTGVYIGSSTGPFLGGLLTQNFGWRSIFLVTIPLILTIFILLVWKVKGEWCESKGQKIDYAGSGIFAASLVVLMYGFNLLPHLTGIYVILTGVIGIIIFLVWESRVSSPLFNIKIFRHNRTFVFSNLAAFMNYSAVFAVAFILSLYLQYVKGLAPGQAGLIMIAHPVVQAILSPLTGKLSDRIEPRIVASIGMALTTIALFSFVFLTNNTPVWRIVVSLGILGVGFSCFLSPNTNALFGSVSPQYYGIASATNSTMISLGQMLSMGIVMVIMGAVVGRVVITPEYYPAFLTSARIAFGFFTALCFCGVFVSFFRGNPRKSLQEATHVK